MSSNDLLAWYVLGFIALHFLFRVLLSSAGIESLAGRLRGARLHSWRGRALLLVIAGSIVLQLARLPVWIGGVTVFPAMAGIWLVSELIAARWLRNSDAPTAVRVVHGVRLAAYLVAIVGLGVVNHLILTGRSPWWVVTGVGAAAVMAVAVSLFAIYRGASDAASEAVRGVLDRMEHSASDARRLADRVEKLVEAGRLDEALQHATPLFVHACEDDAGWGVAGAACGAAQALIIGHTERGELARAGAALDVLEQISVRDIGPLAGLTSMSAMGRVVDALLDAGSRDEATRALRVMAALRRHAPGMEFLFAGPLVEVLTALLDAGELAAAQAVHRELAVGAAPPVTLEPELVARLSPAPASEERRLTHE